MTVDWGDIGGTLSNQTDLQAALDSKIEFSGTDYDVLTWDDDEVVGSSTRTRDASTPQIFNDHVGMARGARLMWPAGSSVPFTIDTSSIYFIQGSVDAGDEQVAARGISSRLYLTDTPGTGNVLRYGIMAVVENRPGVTVTINNGTNNSIQAAHCIVQTNNGSHYGFALGVVGGADNDNGTMGTGIGGDFRTANIGENTSTTSGYAIRAVVGNYSNGANHQDAAFLYTRLRFGGTGEITGKLVGVDFGGLDPWDDGPCAESYMIYFGESCAVGDIHWAIYGENGSGDWRCGNDVEVKGVVRVEGRVKVVTGTSYTILEEDWGRVLVFTSTGTVWVSVPAGLPVGFECEAVRRSASGRVTFMADTGATVASPVGGAPEMASDAARVQLMVWNVGTTTDWVVSGDIKPFAFNPASISSPLCWLDASDPDTLYDAVSGGSPVAPDGTVARWEDKGPYNNHATQPTSGSRPIRKVNVQNGLDTVRFDGTDDLMEAAGAVYDGDAAAIFVVAKSSSVAGYNGAVGSMVQTSEELLASSKFFGLPYKENGRFVSGADDESATGVATGVVANVWNVLTGTRQRDLSDGQRTWRSGAFVADGPTADAPISGDTGDDLYLVVGFLDAQEPHLLSSELHFDGDIGEIIVYHFVPTDSQRRSIEAYLMGKWNI